MKTLYISDLDGTLLKKDLTLSGFTAETINRLTGQGMIFSYATARSIVTAGELTKDIKSNIPVIVHNGAFVMESATKKILLSNFLEKIQSDMLLKVLLKNGIYPLAHAYIDGQEKISFCKEHMSEGISDFISKRPGDKRLNPVSPDKLGMGQVFHFTCIDSEDKLKRIYNEYREQYQCIYYIDIYTGNPWLEILPKNVTKGKAIIELKHLLGCDKIVCFGDAENDIPMFEIADECYAVENAADIIKALADMVIDSNENDGVAKWLLNNYRGK